MPKPQTPDGDRDQRVRTWRLRRDARRSLSVNLAEGIAHSHMLTSFAGAATRHRPAPRPRA